MLTKYLIPVLLPAIAYSSITIKIRPNKDGSKTTVDFLGEEISVVSDKDREIFKIDDETLKKATGDIKGRRCSDVYLKPPTPWGDVYKKFNWAKVHRTVKPISAKVIGVESKPVAVGTAEYVNNHHSISVTYSTGVTQNVEESTSHSWSQGRELGIGQEIKYEVNFGAGSVGGSTSLSYTASWGEETAKSRSVTIGTTSSVLATVPPGGKVLATLIATQGTVDIEIRYSTRLDGKVFCNYDGRYKGHYFYAMPLKKLQNTAKTPLVHYSTETIKVGFYTSVRLEVSNGTAFS